MSSHDRAPRDQTAPPVAHVTRPADEALGIVDVEPGRQTGRQGGEHVRVLVVEDDAGLRETLSSALCDVGFACTVAPDGMAALAACQRRDPDLVILDLNLPGLDGSRFADAYRRIPGSSARILVISGTDRGAETASRIRADAFLSKPFEMDTLLGTVSRLLRLAA